MQVHSVSTQGIEPRSTEQLAVERAARSPGDQALFRDSQKLNQALRDSPEVRSHEVARAQGLVSSLKYPPAELIGRLARLLAFNERPADK